MGRKGALAAKKHFPEGLKVAELEKAHNQGKPKQQQTPKTKPAPSASKQDDSSAHTSRTQSSRGSRGDLGDLTDVEPEFEGDVLTKKTHDLETLQKLIGEYERLMASRLAVVDRNMNPDYEEFEKLRSSRKLDANLKKCTNYVKKLKSINTAQFDQIAKEFQDLNLTKYLSEIATALTEARFAVTDIQHAVNLFSMFHQRYREFGPQVLEFYQKLLVPRKADFKSSVVSKLQVDLRLFGELVLCGLFDKEEGFNLILSAIRNIVSVDKDGMKYINLISTFCRGLGYDFAELIPKNVRELCEEHKMSLPENNAISQQKKEQLRKLLLGYYSSCCAEIEKYHENVLDSEMKNRKLLKAKGEIPEDRQNAHSDLQDICDSNLILLGKFATSIDKELPTLRELPADPDADEADNMLRILNAEHGDTVLPASFQIYEDEEMRLFYQDIPDMKVYLPQIAYRDNILKAAEKTAEIEKREKELANMDEELEAEFLTNEKTDEEDEEGEASDTSENLPSEQIEEEKGETIKPNFKAFLDGLTNCFNSTMIDRTARDFVDNFNTKPNRKRLVNTLFRIPWQRVDLIPLWSRLVATLAPVMPELQFDLCQLLFKDFRFLVRKKDQLFIETKLKIVRYIGELVKFGVFPKSDAFQCFKTLLLNFTHHQIEMACAFMETCGRFLHRSPDSHRRMQIYLEEFMRRKTLKSLDARYVSMVDHAYTTVCPPKEGPRIKQPEMLCFIKYIVYDILHRSNLDDSIQLMRSLDWEEPDVENYFIRVMSKPWYLGSQQYSPAASLLAAIKPHRSHVPVHVVDIVLEGFYQMVGSTHPSYNSPRVAMINFIGEFYNYRLVGSTEIFSILYTLISHQVVLDHNYISPSDPPDNLFRIRLVCTLLNTCGAYFSHGNGKMKLNYFLKYFVRYVWFKKSSYIWTETRRYPFVINDLVDETMDMLRPGSKWPNSFSEACIEVAELEEKLRTTYFTEEMLADTQQQLQDAPEEEEMYEGESYAAYSDMIQQQQQYLPEPSSTPSDTDHEGSAEVAEVVTEANWEKFKPTTAELAEFDSQMERLAIEYTGGRHAKADIPVPIKTSPTKGLNTSGDVGEGNVKVALLTRKGNKQQIKHISISEGTEFVKRITASQQAEEQERRRIKQLTLGINRRQQEEEDDEVRHKYEAMFRNKRPS